MRMHFTYYLIHNLSVVVHILKDFTKSFEESDNNFRTVHVELILSNNIKNISFNDRNIISIEELEKKKKDKQSKEKNDEINKGISNMVIN